MTTHLRTAVHQRGPAARSARYTLGTLAVVATLALVGCAPTGSAGESASPVPEESSTSTATPTPEASGTPTPAAQAAPTSADDAVAGSALAVQEYITQWVLIRNDPSVDPQTITATAYDQGAQSVINEAKKFRDAGVTVTGNLGYEPDGNALASAATVDGTAMEFGAVQMSGCLDTTEIAGTNADGTAAGTSTDKRYVWEFGATYLPSAGRWMVSRSDLPEVLASC
ncbi:MAG: hypothetical protein JWQ43_131 [Glaciihabitans sp.]|nr:hypothetical protein [Glaciihabitans sp.]